MFFLYKYRIFIFLLLILSLANFISHAEKNPKNKIKHWGLNIGVSSFYDNNILKYSDKYLERFKKREDEGRFHINRYDDLVMDYSIKISFNNNFIKNLKTIFSASVDFNSYSYNTVKSWSSVDFGWQQNVSKDLSFMLSYSHIPEFYVNHFRDEDWINLYGFTPETFQSYTFSKNDYSLWLQYNIMKSTNARFYFSLMKYYYNEHFTEYDSDNYLLGIRLSHSLTKKIDIDCGYKYVSSKAKGYDESFESKNFSDDVNADYDEHIFTAGIDFRLPNLLKRQNDISLGAQYSRRLYNTNHFGEEDPLHAGRYDNYYRININYNIQVLKYLSTGFFFNLLNRDSETTFKPNEEYISDEKDYSQYQLGINFNYKLLF